jgi:hypothetical protein
MPDFERERRELVRNEFEDYTSDDIMVNSEEIRDYFTDIFSENKATEEEIKIFIDTWFSEEGLRDSRIEDFLFEMLDIMVPRPYYAVEDDPFLADFFVRWNLRLYKYLIDLSPVYVIDEIEKLGRMIPHVVKPNDELLAYIIRESYWRSLHGYDFSKIFHIDLDYNNLPLTLQAILDHPYLPANIRRSSGTWGYQFNSFHSQLREGIIMKLNGKLYERYVENPVQINSVPIMNLPPVVQTLLSERTVLSGGSLVKRVAGGFVSNTSNVSNLLCGLLEKTPACTKVGDQDYDLYTTLSPTEVDKHMRKYKFTNTMITGILKNAPDLSNNAALSYTAWLLTYTKDNTSIDVIFIHRYVDPRRPLCERPQDFIMREFDIDIAKIWFDGSVVQACSQQIVDHIKSRQMTLDFHPEMTINKHKTRTTIQRLRKYESRGFEIVTVNNMNQFQELVNRYYRLTVINPKYKLNDDMVLHILKHFEPMFQAKKDQILAYSEYFKQVREEKVRNRQPIPEVALVPRPEEYDFLIKILRARLYSSEIIEPYFKELFGITPYELGGGIAYFFQNYYTGFMYVKTGGWDNLPYFSPAFVKDYDFLPQNFRWTLPNEPELPTCQTLFTTTVKPSSEKFSDKLKLFKKQCDKLDMEPPCSAYYGECRESINEIFHTQYIETERNTTMRVRRGAELRALWNIRESFMKTRFNLYIVYENEPGIDAGGLTREFLLNCCVQAKALFSYINEESLDPRMYLSNEEDNLIVDRLNRNLREEERFRVEDLPELYNLVARLFVNAVLLNFSTEIPLSRLLLEAMTSKDTGVKKDLIRTIYIMETNYNMDMIYFYDEDPAVSEKYLKDTSKETYFLEKNHPKREYVGEFVRGFRSVGKILAFLKILPKELYAAICASNISRRTFENHFRRFVIYDILDELDDHVETSGVELETFKDRFLDMLLNTQYQERLINKIKSLNVSGINWADLSDDQVLEFYYVQIAKSISGFNVLDDRRPLKVRFVKNTNVAVFAHTCFRRLDLSADLMNELTLDIWLDAVVPSFFEKTFTES